MRHSLAVASPFWAVLCARTALVLRRGGEEGEARGWAQIREPREAGRVWAERSDTHHALFFPRAPFSPRLLPSPTSLANAEHGLPLFSV